MVKTRCALCGETRECSAKEIDAKEYDVCSECWNELSQKLSGKGREIKHRTTALIPPLETRKEVPEPPSPDEPPKIWCRAP